MATNGNIARLVAGKGFGFIRLVSGDGDVFFHRSAMDITGRSFDELATGDAVQVEIEDSAKGPRASWVRCGR